MAIKLVAFLSILLSLSQAVKHYGPKATNPAADELDPYDWSPKPTPGPEQAGFHGALRFRRQQTLLNTCAYFNNEPIACPANEYCAFNTASPYFGCCSVDSNGIFLPSCSFDTACVNAAQSSALCAASTFTDLCIGSLTGICGPANSAYSECATYVLTGGIVPLTSLGCFSQAGAVITVASTPPPIPSISTTPSTTSSTTPTTTPLTTTTPSPSITSPSPVPSSPVPTHSPSHTGAIAGGVVGGVAAIALVAALIGFVVHRMRVKKREELGGPESPEMTGSAYIPKG